MIRSCIEINGVQDKYKLYGNNSSEDIPIMLHTLVMFYQILRTRQTTRNHLWIARRHCTHLGKCIKWKDIFGNILGRQKFHYRQAIRFSSWFLTSDCCFRLAAEISSQKDLAWHLLSLFLERYWKIASWPNTIFYAGTWFTDSTCILVRYGIFVLSSTED